jgi:voltage-dependent calcium channel
MLRMMSQRVVNLSNDSGMVEQSVRRKASIGDSRLDGPPTLPAMADYAHDGPADQRLDSETPLEKVPSLQQLQVHEESPSASSNARTNPLRGNSLGIFGPENRLRKALCEILVHPVTEPIILVLIISQTVLLAVEAAPSVYDHPRTDRNGISKVDYALLVLFILYTIEVIARMIVSGFMWNPHEYSTLNRSIGLRKAIGEYGRSLFAPQRQASERRSSVTGSIQPSVLRSFTGLSEAGFSTRLGPASADVHDMSKPGHGRQQQRNRLARRAFLRHSFNRLDLVAVVSFWISFALTTTHYENKKHVYVFSMLSCLRILRLLGLTSGTSIILRSLKKAAPLLVNVAFLIGFFWLLFAIVGVQSFKSSLRRTCVWINPDGVSGNYTQNIAPGNLQFCGGHLDATTGLPMPWLTPLGQNGTKSAKGYLCPQGSFCVEGDNPYNGTVSFDNILQSIELVFVVISANTFTDLLYYLTNSDYVAAALFFAAGIVIMTLWLTNLLVAVITSSFQIIREESKRSAFTAEKIEEPSAPEDKQSDRKGLKGVFEKTYWFWISVITVGLVVQCLRSASMSETRLAIIMDTETGVTFMLLLEILLRFITDWRNFFYSRRNLFDLGLAIITAIIQIPEIRNSGQAYAWLSFFQILRVYRVVMAFTLTRDLILVVFSNIVGLVNLIVFVFLLTFLAAILASQLFRGEIPAIDPLAQATIHITFFNIYNSWIGMYQILSSENWTIILYNVTRFDAEWDTAWLGAIFFIMWFILANFIVLNMFIAVIQESFDVSEDEKRLEQVKAFLLQKELTGSSQGNLSLASIFKLGRDSFRRRDPLDYGPATVEQLLKDAVVKEFLDEPEEPLNRRSTANPLGHLPAAGLKPGALSAIWGKIRGLNPRREPNPFYSTPTWSKAHEDLDPRTMAKTVVADAEQRRRAQRQYLIRHPNYNKALFIFKPNNPIRRFCQTIVGPGRGSERIEGDEPWKPVWYSFSAFIYAAIVAMVLLACVTTPVFQREYYETHSLDIRNWFVWTDMSFAILFTIEAIIKVVADGFFFTPNAYFRGTWGFIDGIVLVTLWINVITSLYRDDGVSRAVGAFKALRALRLLNVSDSAQNTFHSVIIGGGWKIVSAAFVSLSLLIPFAILGLNLFNGQMEICNDSSFAYGANLTDCVGEYGSSPFNWTVLAPHVVSNPYYSFDNFGDSLFILFQIVSQEGWIDVMWSAMSMTGKGNQPQPFAAQGNAMYFIIFNLLGSVFVLTLFVSVFMRNHTEQTGVAFLTADQRSWLELRKLLRQISPSKRSLGKSATKWQVWCYRLAVQKHGKWQRFITTVLLSHLTLLIIEFYPEPLWWTTLRNYIFLLFTIIYLFNVIIRIIGLSWKRFRRSSWDLYSVVAVGGVLVTTVMTLSKYTDTTFDQLHKLFLVAIAFLLIPRNNQLDQLFKTAAASLGSIGNLLATWFVLFLVYAIAFTQTFGLTRFGPNESVNLNFRDVPKALILLFRMSCGEGWNAIMEDFATIVPPYCVHQDSFFQSDCGDAAWARALFISWNIISMYIFVSLFVSLIFESFSYVYQRSSGMAAVSRDEIRRFKQAWSEFDPNGTGYISKETFPRLLGVRCPPCILFLPFANIEQELSGVFSMRIYEDDYTIGKILEDCSINQRDSFQVHTSGRMIHGIDLDRLNNRLNSIPVADIRKKRARMNVFYEEIMVSADPDRGISFTSCLMTLAHYNVIDDTKSLRLDEFLKRRARLQRVDESIKRNIVRGFFDTMYWSRWLRRHKNYPRDSRMAGPPQLTVPEIFVEDPDDTLADSKSPEPQDFTEAVPVSPRIMEPGTSSSSFNAHGVPRIDTTLRRRDSSKTSPTRDERSPSPNLSPGNSPGWLYPTDTSYPGPDRATTPTSPRVGHSRQGSAVSSTGAQGVMESFDNSAWGESIRRSFTLRRPSRS